MVVQRAAESYEFRLYLPHANVVEVVGDFTRWQEGAVAMARGHDGWWSVNVPVPSGVHRFSYLVDGRYWMPDYAANGIEHNEHGQWVSRLDVEAVDEAPARGREPGRAGVPGRSAEPTVREPMVKVAARPLAAGGAIGAA
jgi:1,4-alpha-glucan branching enzyme